MVTDEKMIHSYLKLRDKKLQLEEVHKKEMKKFAEAMALIEAYLKKRIQEHNLQNIASPEATAFLQSTRKATLADSGVFREFVIANSNFDLADMRPKVDVVEEYVAEHNGHPPPGVNFSTALVVRVQRK